MASWLAVDPSSNDDHDQQQFLGNLSLTLFLDLDRWIRSCLFGDFFNSHPCPFTSCDDETRFETYRRT